ncbi:HIT family protein [Actinophytocola oryzae]|uniref:HIT family protein n=1 Tax=Actinophytocola oryzae TaxID=502181 RepID=UPI001062F662|nr:hypothetical protein [Actinophytocola oryzae]
MSAARAVEAVFEPVKLNISMLGNGLPHLHAHVVPRHAVDDPRPNNPLPHDYLVHGRQDETRFLHDAATLASAARST